MPPNQSIENFIWKGWRVAERIEYFDIRDDAKRSKDSGALEPDTCFQVGKDLSIAALIWQAFFAYFFGRLQKSKSPDHGAGSATRTVLRSRTLSVWA